MAGSAYLLSPRARRDLEDIWDYTTDHWGADQAERYVRELQAGIESAAKHPEKGQACDDIRPGYLRARVGSHVVFYRLHSKGIHVVRILHQRMDFERHM